MKPKNFLYWSALSVLVAMVFLSCNKNELNELELRINELEELVNMEDTVLFSDLVISSQETMNLMADRKITNIVGNLFIDNCTDLSPLAGLKSVEALYIQVPNGLNSLEGLNDLTSTRSINLSFQGSQNVDVSALDGITSVRSISLDGNVPSVDWFNNIESLADFYVYATSGSFKFSGLENLTEIDYLSIYSYEGTIEVAGFASITSIRNLELSAMTLTVSGFDNLTSIGFLGLSGNNVNISGLNKITTLQDLYLSGSSLQMSGLNSLANLSYLSLYGEVINITGLQSLQSLIYLDISANTSVSGLNTIKTVGNLNLSTPQVDNLLTNMTTVESLNLYSYGNSSTIKSLADLGFASLTSMRGLSVSLPSLESLDGFDFSNSDLQYFNAYYCPKLTDLTGLTTYTGQLENLHIDQTALATLEGLDNVTGIDYLYVSYNTALDNWCAIKDIFDNIPSSQRYIDGNLVNPASSDEILGCN